MRNKILEINKNPHLTKQEKQRDIQLLHQPQQHQHHQQQQKEPCTHYVKHCSELFFSCCNTTFSCHRCHNEQCIHKGILATVKCNQCQTHQSPSNACVICTMPFGNYWCPVCTIWTNKPIFHCESCGICRVGELSEYTHCNDCNLCYRTDANHRCSGVYNTECGFCFEPIHTSQKSSFILNCSHGIHSACFTLALHNNQYTCSLCRKSMIDMTAHWARLKYEIEQQPMPTEPIDMRKKVTILCHDCNGVTPDADFHFIGIECGTCASFNCAVK